MMQPDRFACGEGICDQEHEEVEAEEEAEGPAGTPARCPSMLMFRAVLWVGGHGQMAQGALSEAMDKIMVQGAHSE